MNIYTNEDNPHQTEFCEDKVGLKSLSNGYYLRI